MKILNEREKYCLSLIIANGGKLDYEIIKNIILNHRESFSDLSERYLKYKAIKKTLLKLEGNNFVSELNEIYEINPIIEAGFVQEYPIIMVKAIKNFINYRNDHILQFDTTEVEDYILNYKHFVDHSPYGLIENLKDALELQKMKSYDSVLVKCGKCVEIMVNYLDENFELFETQLSTGRMIRKFGTKEIEEKIEDDVSIDTWRTFSDGINVVYRFRNLMGAHESWSWGEDQVATSCLILTFYLVDIFLTLLYQE